MKTETRFYWTASPRYQLANFRLEVKQAGQIIQPEQPLTIVGNVLQTSDPKKIKFIEKSPAFKDGEIELVPSLDVANAKTHEHNRKRLQARMQNVDDEIQSPAQVETITVAGTGMGAG